MGSETISAVMSALAVILGMIGAMFSVKHTASSIEKTADGDAKEAKEAAQKVQEGNKDIISLMLNNMSELREYYVINKRQANRVFNATLTACVMGGIIFIIGSIVAFWGGQKVSFYTTISGCVVELISGLFFWLYKRTIDQLNLYHERLGSTEKYLTAVQLVDKMSEQEKDSMYRYIIEMMLIDNSSKCRKKKPPENKIQNT